MFSSSISSSSSSSSSFINYTTRNASSEDLDIEEIVLASSLSFSPPPSSPLSMPSSITLSPDSSIISRDPNLEAREKELIAIEKEIVQWNLRLIRDPSHVIQKLEKTFRRAQKELSSMKLKKITYNENGKSGHLVVDQFYSKEASRIGRSFRVSICQDRGNCPEVEQSYLINRYPLDCRDGRSFQARIFALFDDPTMRGFSANNSKIHFSDYFEDALVKYNKQKISSPGIWNALQRAFVQMSIIHIGDYGASVTMVMILAGKIWTASIGNVVAILDNQGTAIQLNPLDNRRLGKGCFQRDKSARCKISIYPLKDIQPGSHIILSCKNVFRVINTKAMVKVAHESKKTAGQFAKNIVSSAKIGVGSSMGSRSVIVISL